MLAMLWCNGETPSDRVIAGLVEGKTVFGVDGGADKAAESGYEVARRLATLIQSLRVGAARQQNFQTSRAVI
ncbi:MAG: hypothetical protein CM1200mP21_09540 [Candidatus Poseidoniales archaeon]|nr:MAG: hypothetical protein CM1200mP21_09540 [Candidatus Poseidoniales archaeon]